MIRAVPQLAIVDFSWYGNPFDAQSNALLIEALRKRGVTAGIVSFPRDHRPDITASRAWLRYDVRKPDDLQWVAETAQLLKRAGITTFPTAEAIVASEDKWATAEALKKARIPIPLTVIGRDAFDCGFPVILKPRVGWGAMNTWVIRFPGDPGPAKAEIEDYIAQPFISHERTLIAAMAGGRPIVCIEDRGGGISASGRVGTVPFPDQGAELASQALSAVGLIAGTVDLIEIPDGLLVLEVNSAPRLTYPHLPKVDLAGPIVDSVYQLRV